MSEIISKFNNQVSYIDGKQKHLPMQTNIYQGKD